MQRFVLAIVGFLAIFAGIAAASPTWVRSSPEFTNTYPRFTREFRPAQAQTFQQIPMRLTKDIPRPQIQTLESPVYLNHFVQH